MTLKLREIVFNVMFLQKNKINKLKQKFELEEFKNELLFCNYLKEVKFQRTLEKHIKQLKNKTVVIYGVGLLFRTILKYYDLSKLNIIAISDMKYANHSENETDMGYKVITLDEIKELNPDYILVATRFYVDLIEVLYYGTFRKTGIKIKPLVKKSFRTILKEIWK